MSLCPGLCMSTQLCLHELPACGWAEVPHLKRGLCRNHESLIGLERRAEVGNGSLCPSTGPSTPLGFIHRMVSAWGRALQTEKEQSLRGTGTPLAHPGASPAPSEPLPLTKGKPWP